MTMKDTLLVHAFSRIMIGTEKMSAPNKLQMGGDTEQRLLGDKTNKATRRVLMDKQ